jgi:hypothetical protein
MDAVIGGKIEDADAHLDSSSPLAHGDPTDYDPTTWSCPDARQFCRPLGHGVAAHGPVKLSFAMPPLWKRHTRSI